MKVFHKYKKVNPETGRQNPTVVNGSWGYFAGFNSATTVDYSFKGTTGSFTGYASNSTGVQAMAYGLEPGNVYDRQYSTSSRSSSIDTAGNEMVESGAIFVVAAGNDNQRVGRGTDDPHLNDYLTTLNSSDSRAGIPQGSGTCPSGHRKWMHPNGVGHVADGTEQEYYHTINVGCLDEHTGPVNVAGETYAERKVSYSNNGPGIDVFGPGDETLSAGVNGVVGATDYQRYDDSRFYDMFFNGTSAASPIVAGVVALYMQSNPSATSYDVHEWIKNYGSKVFDTSQFIDEYPDDTNDDYWRELYNLRGAEPRIIHDPFANDTVPKFNGVNISGISFKQS
jgi:subtilisin family serine protease